MKTLMHVTQDKHLIVALYARAIAGCIDSEVMWDMHPSGTDDFTDSNYVIRAVCIHSNDDDFWCAVARANKTLDVYQLGPSSDKHRDVSDVHRVTAMSNLSTQTNNLICSMVFASVPPPSHNSDGDHARKKKSTSSKRE
jgi:hypothetical protein